MYIHYGHVLNIQPQMLVGYHRNPAAPYAYQTEQQYTPLLIRKPKSILVAAMEQHTLTVRRTDQVENPRRESEIMKWVWCCRRGYYLKLHNRPAAAAGEAHNTHQ